MYWAVGPFHSWAPANRFYSQEVDCLFSHCPLTTGTGATRKRKCVAYRQFIAGSPRNLYYKNTLLVSWPRQLPVVYEYRPLRLRLSNFLRQASGPPRPLGEQCFLHPLRQELDRLFSLNKICCIIVLLSSLFTSIVVPELDGLFPIP